MRLNAQAPDGVSLQCEPWGTAYYGQMRYGNSDSTRVTVVVNRSDENTSLYVDHDRDRCISDDELVAGGGSEWSLTLNTRTSEGPHTLTAAREVMFKLSGSQLLLVRTRGFMKGVVTIDGPTVRARRVDGNANGLFNDAHDMVWLDLNDDRKWDEFTERFGFAPIVTLDGERYTIRSDSLGSVLNLEKLRGTGKLRVNLDSQSWCQHVAAVECLFSSQGGIGVSTTERDVDYEVPVGDYQLIQLKLALRDDSGNLWTYRFTRRITDRQVAPLTVKVGETTAVDPAGEFTWTPPSSDTAVKRGAELVVFPCLNNSQGLQLQIAFRGDDENNPSKRSVATTTLIDDEGKILGNEKVDSREARFSRPWFAFPRIATRPMLFCK
jgi:hypothetical protein